MAAGDAARMQDVVQRCALPLLCTHGANTAVLLCLSSSFAHDPHLLRAASRALSTSESVRSRSRSRSPNTLLLACVVACVSLRRLKEVMCHAPDSAFGEGNCRDVTPLSAACTRLRPGDFPSLCRALALAGSPHCRAADFFSLAQLYYSGEVVAQDYGKAMVWCRKAAEKGDVAAQSNLGDMYRHGRVVPRDEVQAVAWYRRAAEQGDASAQNSLGAMYAGGRGGLPQDDAQAVAWIRRAAEQGLSDGQSNMGVMYVGGRGDLPQDDTQAVAWFRKAAEQGDSDGQYNLGAMYEGGRGGVPQDYEKAAAWYKKAVAGGAPVQADLARVQSLSRGAR